ncbi:hypothetical protein EVAR_39143_1 [Eumeta japonica]|uniref:Uncharacterized protein n=1 Tax=Eumeta variegata TaxID=151549 RepID=A0A4C1X5M3_EUMVA|nr:hypothetical protein EVAR_39143_1 [Eumeta japonica]
MSPRRAQFRREYYKYTHCTYVIVLRDAIAVSHTPPLKIRLSALGPSGLRVSTRATRPNEPLIGLSALNWIRGLITGAGERTRLVVIGYVCVAKPFCTFR